MGFIRDGWGVGSFVSPTRRRRGPGDFQGRHLHLTTGTPKLPVPGSRHVDSRCAQQLASSSHLRSSVLGPGVGPWFPPRLLVFFQFSVCVSLHSSESLSLLHLSHVSLFSFFCLVSFLADVSPLSPPTCLLLPLLTIPLPSSHGPGPQSSAPERAPVVSEVVTSQVFFFFPLRPTRSSRG